MNQLIKLLSRNQHLNIIMPLLCAVVVTTRLRCTYRLKVLRRQHKYTRLPLRTQGRVVPLEIRLVLSKASFHQCKTRSLSLESQLLSNLVLSLVTIHLSLPRTSRPFISSDSIQCRHSCLPHRNRMQ